MNTDTDTNRDGTVAAPCATYSHVARPEDSRCRWWQRIATEAEVLAADPAAVDGAGGLPGRYVRSGSDHELAPWSVVFDGEAEHHRKQRGWHHVVGIVVPQDDGSLALVWIAPTDKAKAAIKASGYAAHLMGGSGPNAGCLRIVRFILGGITDAVRCERLVLVRSAS